MSCEGGSQCWQMFVSLQAPESFRGFLHSRRRPAQRHRGRSPSLYVAANAAHGAHHVLDDVSTGERSTQVSGKPKAADGENLVEPFQNACRHAWRIMLQSSGEVPDELLGLVGIIELPG